MKNTLPIIAILCALAPFACVAESDFGSGGGSSSSVTASVLFPPNVSSTDEHRIIVRGVASGNIDGLEVGGYDAESSDGFETWTAEVTIDNAQQTFTVVAFRDGHSPSFNLDSFTIMRDHLVGTELKYIDMDPGWTTIYAYAKNPDLNASASETWAVLAVEPLSGRALVVSGWGVGNGPSLTSSVRMITAVSGEADLYLLDGNAQSVIHVDAVNGVRTTVSSPSIGSGPNLSNPKQALYIADHELLYVFDDGLDAILSVNVATGQREVVASDSVGAGPSIAGVRDIAYDKNRGVLYASSPSSDGILQVAINNGQRTLISGVGIGTGPQISTARDLEYDDALDRIIAYAPNGARLLAVDPATGTRTELQSFPWTVIDDMTYNPLTQKAWLHTEEEVTMSYDIPTGETQILHSFAFPGHGVLIPTTGPIAYDSTRDSIVFFGKEEGASTLRGLSFESGSEYSLEAYYPSSEPNPVGMAFDARRDNMLMLQPGQLGLYGLDLDNGQMTYLSGSGNPGDPPAGTGSNFDEPREIATGPELRYAAVADEGLANGLIFVDLLTGDRALSSSNMSGFGPLWSEPCSVATTESGPTAWVCDSQARIYSVDRETGGRTLIGEYGGVAGVETLTKLIYDEARETLYALDGTTGTILKVHPLTGLASIIYGASAQVAGIHVTPTNWTIDTARDTVILATESPASLLVFDPDTRQTVLVAR